MHKRVKTQRRIWLIGGTGESAKLAIGLLQIQLPLVISVTTESARSLYPNSPLLQVWVGRFNLSEIEEFLTQQNIIAVLDASHPYAVEISQNAIAACQKQQIPYLRFERPRWEVGGWGDGEVGGKLIYLDSFEKLVTGDYLVGERVLFTVGYKVLPLFRDWHKRSTLFARVLPATTSIDAALAAGFTQDKLFAMRPPIPINLERELWRHWQISMVVTKASGAPGGEDVKRQLAAELGVTLLIIEPPIILYPRVTSDLGEAIAFCQQHFGSQNV
ncbi:cobalt-precorrin-6A reductase [[Phormidium ambiguum] IAM M-71]|uniref:Cobalt-precorrin-6A reductase n=1 Tax=[Phormidium ambiguum] IAM M-71 TaxID=454136 RepID=A0A1U7IK19_9CYAN|nr:cobalt-precorrin-6A reductase [Phormidium ambiguum]OKH37560.1 cobalt-precorrin-6A reductase [Phormidium ambiguum IAM M-71]